MRWLALGALLALVGACGGPALRPEGPVASPSGGGPRAGTLPAREAEAGVSARDEAACREGDAEACRGLAEAYTRGAYVPRDAGRAAALFRAACAGGSKRACFDLELHRGDVADADDVAFALLVLAERDDLSLRDESGATAEVLAARCLTHDGWSCAELARSHEEGNGVPKDAAQAHELHRLACVQGYWFSCNNLTVTYRDPLGEEVSRERFARLCEQGFASDCYWLAARYLTDFPGFPARPEEGRALLERACDGGYGTACYSLAERHAYGAGGTPVDLPRYIELLTRGCEGGSPDACGELHAPMAQLEEACRAGDRAGCALRDHRRQLAD